MIKLPSRNYETLDAVAVVGSLAIVAGIIFGLFAFKLDPAVAPIVSSLATAILGLPVSYGAFRWGNSVGTKTATDAAAEATKAATGALAAAAASVASTAPESASTAPVEGTISGDVTLTPKEPDE